MANLTIVMYHSVSATVDPYTVSPQAFRQQIEFIANTYPVVRLKDVSRQAQSDDGRNVVITFDDAFADCLESAFPVLAKRSIPSTLFVPTAHLGGWNSWDREMPAIARKRVMSTQEMCRLCAAGLVDVGSHTVDHRNMRGLSSIDMHTQAAVSKRFLEDALGAPVEMFSYPYGQRDNFSSRTSSVLSEAGYRIAVTTCWGTHNSTRDLLTLRRISFTEHDDLSTIRAKIEGRYDWLGVKEALGYAWRSSVDRLRPRWERTL